MSLFSSQPSSDCKSGDDLDSSSLDRRYGAMDQSQFDLRGVILLAVPYTGRATTADDTDAAPQRRSCTALCCAGHRARSPISLSLSPLSCPGGRKKIFLVGGKQYKFNQKDYIKSQIDSIMNATSLIKNSLTIFNPHPAQNIDELKSMLSDFDKNSWKISNDHILNYKNL